LRREEDLGAVGAHRLAPLGGKMLRHDEHHAVAADGGRHRQRDPGVAGGGLDQRVARLDLAARLGVADHGDGRAVLHRARRVVALELRQHHVAVSFVLASRQALQAHQRRIADGILEGAPHRFCSSFT
jgi:hypothetical protein